MSAMERKALLGAVIRVWSECHACRQLGHLISNLDLPNNEDKMSGGDRDADTATRAGHEILSSKSWLALLQRAAYLLRFWPRAGWVRQSGWPT